MWNLLVNATYFIVAVNVLQRISSKYPREYKEGYTMMLNKKKKLYSK